MRPQRQRRNLRSFTLVEVVIAAVIAAFLMGTITLSMSNLGRVKNSSKHRFAALMRADTALNALRRDAATATRANDLFYSRVLITSNVYRAQSGEEYRRDELLIFNTSLMNIRAIDYSGEGLEYETQFRIEEDDLGPVLWQRRDALPDTYPDGGGMVTPIVDGIVGLQIEAFDGFEWTDEWDSDYDGIPMALRFTIWASGARDGESAYEREPAVLRTIASIDRVEPPFDHTRLALEQMFEDLAAAEAEAAAQGGGDEGGNGTTGDASGDGTADGRTGGGRGRGRGNTGPPTTGGLEGGRQPLPGSPRNNLRGGGGSPR
ncbi:MAG: prepilin-type N-terminal cleavage/methylation domain-containing protein [Planctomycetota bacterium]